MQRFGTANKRISQSSFFVIQYNFFYTQLVFAFYLVEDFYIVYEHIHIFYFFFLRNISTSMRTYFHFFSFFFFRKILILFTSFFFRLSFVFRKIMLTFLYIAKLFINIWSFIRCFKKLAVPYELCKLYELYILLKSLKMTWDHLKS